MPCATVQGMGGAYAKNPEFKLPFLKDSRNLINYRGPDGEFSPFFWKEGRGEWGEKIKLDFYLIRQIFEREFRQHFVSNLKIL